MTGGDICSDLSTTMLEERGILEKSTDW